MQKSKLRRVGGRVVSPTCLLPVSHLSQQRRDGMRYALTILIGLGISLLVVPLFAQSPSKTEQDALSSSPSQARPSVQDHSIESEWVPEVGRYRRLGTSPAVPAPPPFKGRVLKTSSERGGKTSLHETFCGNRQTPAGLGGTRCLARAQCINGRQW